MSRAVEDSLRAELRELREGLRLLTLRVDRLQDLLAGQGQTVELESSDSGYQAVQAPSTTGFSVVEAEPSSSAAPSWEFREEVAREIGAFFIRALAGSSRGSSGRQRLPQLKSRIYIIAKDWNGREYRRPVKVTTKFSDVKSLCSRSGDFADSVFCGVPSLREARIVGADLPEEENTPSQVGAVEPRSFVVVWDDDAVLEYSPGRLFLDTEQTTSCSVIAVAVINEKLLVAVPQEVWHRQSSRRKLANTALSKPVLVSVAACSGLDQSNPLAGNRTVKAWFGFIHEDLESGLEFPEAGDPTYGFGQHDGMPLLPFGVALRDVARDQFGFVSAESGNNGLPVADPTAQRLEQLETMFSALQSKLDQLLTSGEAPKSKAAPKRKPAIKPPPRKEDGFPGLDEGVVAAALKAGIPSAHLAEMSKIMTARPKKLEDIPRQTNVLSDCEPEEDEVDDGGGEVTEVEGEASDGSGVAKAIVQLTKICSKLSDSKSKKGDGLEHLLDGLGSATTGESSSLPGNRRNAAALRALQKCLRENPKLLYESIEAQMATDFSSQVCLPGEPLQPGLTARGWLVSRSRLQQYQTHIRWSWQVAGIMDCLMQNRPQEARARCGLLLGAADQASIDGGSWLLGNIALLEPTPPYHLFNNRGQITNQDLQHTALFDPRWMEVFLGHVKEVDSYQEAKRKLGKGAASSPNAPLKDDEQKKPNPKYKAKAKAKGASSSNNASTAAEAAASKEA
eukprot:Skav214862  [mRNA]  locus=scaffold16:535805:538086:+ [translate_table: standard]